MLKCIECGDAAEFIYNGHSLCSQHYLALTDMSTAWQSKCEDAYNAFIGSRAMATKLVNYFSTLGGRDIPYKHKYRLLNTINEYARKWRMSHDEVNMALGMAIGMHVKSMPALLQKLRLVVERRKSAATEVATGTILDDIAAAQQAAGKE